MTNPNIVAVTADGIELPALPWSDKPEHALGRRAIDEDASRGVALYVKLVNLLALHQFCQKPKCRRAQKCCGARLETSGAKKGLYGGHPPCFGTLQEPVRQVVQGAGQGALQGVGRSDFKEHK